jgi:flagellar basal body-associated protein FliL
MFNPGTAPNTAEADSKSLLIYIGLMIGLIVSALAIIMILI